jgi:hypothetical protein
MTKHNSKALLQKAEGYLTLAATTAAGAALAEGLLSFVKMPGKTKKILHPALVSLTAGGASVGGLYAADAIEKANKQSMNLISTSELVTVALLSMLATGGTSAALAQRDSKLEKKTPLVGKVLIVALSGAVASAVGAVLAPYIANLFEKKHSK